MSKLRRLPSVAPPPTVGREDSSRRALGVFACLVGMRMDAVGRWRWVGWVTWLTVLPIPGLTMACFVVGAGVRPSASAAGRAMAQPFIGK